ncbi:uncharacterized protein LOC115217750 [Octopus sinensis]|uniref:Uncharacterized protein LOC115217750 n=1 Tax=Octopus sinensis TaxID=2607531 RepID=A0A6P7SZT6_9MOLL|nr:uncharacterized protein LOC115217750 [Octopus sinensis]
MSRSKRKRRACLKAYWCLGLVLLCFKKLFMFLFSHVGLTGCVVGYSILGGWIFRGLEGNHERDIRKQAEKMREKYTLKLLKFSENEDSLSENDFENITILVKEFEEEIVHFTESTGWNGLYSDSELQWSFAGSLLFSVTVITTIGYGQLAPKSKWGRVATILYAIVGIPLTFLCLSMIGSSLASIFKFIYKNLFYAIYRKWLRLRTYVDSVESLNYHSTVAAAEAVPVTIAAAAAAVAEIDSNDGYNENDHKIVTLDIPTLTCRNDISDHSTQKQSTNTDCSEDVCEDFSKEVGNGAFSSAYKQSEQDRIEKHFLRRSNSYVRSILGDEELLERQFLFKCTEDIALVPPTIQCKDGLKTELCETGSMGHISPESKDALSPIDEAKPVTGLTEETAVESSESHEHIRVPVSVSLLVFGAYICIGASLFSFWEQEWDYFIGSYFCFITLSTIGLGDFVPGSNGNSWASEEKQAICSLYLLFGMAMTVMCLKLMQEEIRYQFSNLGRKMGLIENDND